jgi:hypothetical protein
MTRLQVPRILSPRFCRGPCILELDLVHEVQRFRTASRPERWYDPLLVTPFLSLPASVLAVTIPRGVRLN